MDFPAQLSGWYKRERVGRGATRNRCAVTPARAVLLHAYDRGWRDLIRVRRFREDRDGLGHLAAMVLFMAQTGARVSEAVATSAIEMGADVATAMEAGGWRSASVFLQTYVQPRKTSGRQVADRFNSRQVMCL